MRDKMHVFGVMYLKYVSEIREGKQDGKEAIEGAKFVYVL